MRYYISACGCLNMFGKSVAEFMENNMGFPPLVDCLDMYKFYDSKILNQYYRLDISCQYLLESVRQVMDKVGEYPFGTRIGIVVGASTGPINIQKRFYETCSQSQKSSAILFKMTPNNIYSGLIALLYGLHNYNVTLYTGATAALDAINLSISLIESRTIDVALVACVESGTEGIMPGSAAVIIDPYDRNHLDIEIFRGKQIHLFTDDEISRYLRGFEEKHSYDVIHCDAQSKRTVQNVALRMNKKILCLEQNTRRFGAVYGLLQVITAMYRKEKTCLLINRYGDQFAHLILKKSNAR